jgi:hypothetical protein
VSAALWSASDAAIWQRALDAYPDVVAAQGVSALPALDTWVRTELPGVIADRTPAHVTLPELVRITEWKMHRGVWRAPNLVRVKSNAPESVLTATRDAFARVPHPTKPIAAIATLDGVGPATASALLAAAHPALYPFFDEIVAAGVPELGAVAWTLGYYAKYAAAVRDRAAALGREWTSVMVERAMWAAAGGKVGDAARG